MKIVWEAVVAVIFPNFAGIVALLGSVSSTTEWYQYLTKPSWTIPNWAFGPVITVLYTMIGFASYLVYRDGGGFQVPATTNTLSVYLVHMCVTLLWTPIFFQLYNVKWSFYCMIVVWLSAAISSGLMFRVSQVAGYIMIPYMVWLSYGTTLNYNLWLANQDGWEVMCGPGQQDK